MEDQSNLGIVEIVDRTTASDEAWAREWRLATSPDEDDIQTEKRYVQFRASIQSSSPNTYLCVHPDKSVCIDGHKDQPSTVFKVVHVYPKNKDYYQLTCNGGQCRDHVLYAEGTKLKARPYHDQTDSLDGGHKEPSNKTLFKFLPAHNGTFYIRTLHDELKFIRSDENGPSNILLSENQSEDVISFEKFILITGNSL